MDELDDLFDIAHGDAMQLIKDDEDKEFLRKQREKGRPGSMAGVDAILAAKEQRKQARVALEEKRKRKRVETMSPKGMDRFQYSDTPLLHPQSKLSMFTFTFPLPDTSADFDWTEYDVGEGQDFECEVEPAPVVLPADEEQEIDSTKKVKRGNTRFITPRLVAALDNSKVSDRYAIHILTAVADALGHRVEDLVINRSTIQRCRAKYREEMSRQIMDEFHNNVIRTRNNSTAK